MRQIGTALNRPASLRYSKVIERMGTRIPAALSICGLFALTLERSPAGKSVSCVMLAPAMGDITTLLDLARHGDSAARERFFTRIYSELNALAGRQLARQPQMTMLDPPALVREAYLRIARLHTLPGADRNAFMAYAARAMRSVIIDYLRSRSALRNGGGAPTLKLAGYDHAALENPHLASLGDALDSLERVDERAHRVVEMRFFAGMDIESIAEFLAISPATVKRDWLKARAFLLHAINNPADVA